MTHYNVLGKETARPTRFSGLGYRRDAADLWRIVDLDGNADPAYHGAVGPHYRTKAELLADLPRYASDYGVSK